VALRPLWHLMAARTPPPEGNEPMTAPRSAQRGSLLRGRWVRAAALAAMAVVVSLLAPSAGHARPGTPATLVSSAGPAASPAQELARLEARAARLSKQYRGELVVLTDAESAARTTVRSVTRLRRQLAAARQQVVRIAAASYMGGIQDPTLALLGGGDPQQVISEADTLQYLGQQRTSREQALSRLITAEQRAVRATQAKIADLRRLITAVSGQRHQVAALIAKFQPESPVIGASITPRMSAVKDEVDRRFGPFVTIGCYRPGSDGEHPLGRACDFMLSTGGVLPAADKVQLGYDVAAWAQANASRLGIMYIIYRQRIWDIRMASSGWVPMSDRGSITANHFDHVHISVF
jgi:hypothetical protein